MDDCGDGDLSLLTNTTLLYEQYRFAELPTLKSRKETYRWKTEMLRICFVIRKAQQPITTRRNVFYGRFCITLAGLVLADYIVQISWRPWLCSNKRFSSNMVFALLSPWQKILEQTLRALIFF